MFNKIEIFNENVLIREIEHKIIREKVIKFSKLLSGRNQSEEYWEKTRKAKNPVRNNIIGKYGEVVANLALRRIKGFPNIKLDFEIREGVFKGWCVDLPYSQIDDRFPDVHVKTCDELTCNLMKSSNKIGYSWTFQNKNQGDDAGRDVLLDIENTNDLVAFMYVQGVWEDHVPEVKLIALAPWVKVKHLLKDPILPKYKYIKKCLYLDDLVKAANG